MSDHSRPTSLRLALWVAFLCFGLAKGLLGQGTAAPQAGDAELQKCEERIASVQREILGRYETLLGELQEGFQKGADLEGAVAVRTERQRITREPVLSEQHLLAEPRSVRALQQQMITKQQELITTVVQESLPRLIEQKRALTIAGRLDEAVALRAAIERLQNSHLPLVRPDVATVIPAETLLQIYTANRARADQVYKGQRVTVRGILGGFRPDAADATRVAVYVTSPTGAGGWLECSFQAPDYLVREEKQFNATFITFVQKGNATPIRMQKGQTIEVRGVCEGWDELVRISKSELVR